MRSRVRSHDDDAPTAAVTTPGRDTERRTRTGGLTGGGEPGQGIMEDPGRTGTTISAGVDGVDSTGLIASLRQAVAAAPEDVALRLRLAELLLDSGDLDGAITEASILLRLDPASVVARALMIRALGETPLSPTGTAADEDDVSAAGDAFNWQAAETEVAAIAGPRFVDDTVEHTEVPAFSTERPSLRLADVAGMDHVKQRLETAFLAPLHNPELSRLYGMSLRGGPSALWSARVRQDVHRSSSCR